MSFTPFEAAQTTDEPARRGPSGRMVAVVVAVVAIVIGGTVGASAVWSMLGGGGPQPESVMPGSVVAFAKIDLNPSAEQKLAAFEFVRKFPQLPHLASSDSDLRHQVFISLQRSGHLQGVDYARDISPWIGSRLGVGILPVKVGTGFQARPGVVVAVAVADADAARRHLDAVARGMNGQCRLLQAYALCTDVPGDLASLVTEAQRHSLASSATYIHDMGQLGSDAFVAGWSDLDAVRRVMPQGANAAGANPFLPMQGQKLQTTPLLGMSSSVQSGRLAVAMRFVGSTVEFVGQVDGAGTTAFGPSSGSGVEQLPKGTLVALGANDVGDAVRSAWPKIDQTLAGFPNAPSGGLASVGRQVGLSLPDDLANALGSQLTIAFGGMAADRSPQIAVVTNGDHASVEKLAAALRRLSGSSAPALRSAGQRSVFAITDQYAGQVATGSGLGQTASFREAVPDASTARFVLYADIAGLRREFKSDIPAAQDKDIAPLSAFGMTISGTGSDVSFRVRLTTR